MKSNMKRLPTWLMLVCSAAFGYLASTMSHFLFSNKQASRTHRPALALQIPFNTTSFEIDSSSMSHLQSRQSHALVSLANDTDVILEGRQSDEVQKSTRPEITVPDSSPNPEGNVRHPDTSNLFPDAVEQVVPSEADRASWSVIVLSGVYPLVNDGRPRVQSGPASPNICLSNEGPISNTWSAVSDDVRATSPPSVKRSLRPDPPQTPYRGHVKVCMHWNSFAWWQDYWKEYGNCRGDDYCDLPCGNIHCRYSWRKENFNQCSAVVMRHHLDSYVGDAPYLRKVLTITEPLYKDNVEDCLSDRNKEARKDVDIVAQWHRSAHIFLGAHNNQFGPGGESEFVRQANFGHLSCPPRPEVAEKTAVQRRMGLTVFNHGNCASANGFREQYVRELQKYIQVDAYGGCLHNKDRPSVGEWRYEQEIGLRSHYKFALAFENQINDDFVSEKVYHCLASGSVPVYYGASNVGEFLPCSNCIIEARKFQSAEELAKYLIYLDQNTDKYMEYHAWRSKPMKIPLLMEVSKAYLYCGVCQAVADDIEGNLTHLEWDSKGEQWVPDPSRRPKPAPPTWTLGLDD